MAPPDACSRIGSLLPDLIDHRDLAEVGPDFRRGIAQHQAVDLFTDSHPMFRRSVERVPAYLRRFGGIIVDVFYDHVLSREWSHYADGSVHSFLDDFDKSLGEHYPRLPRSAVIRLEQIRRSGLLRSYGTVTGITHALQRLSMRLRRPVQLEMAAPVLESHYADFLADFQAFFPALREHAAQAG